MGNGRTYGEQSTVSSYSTGQEGRAGQPSAAPCMRTGRRRTVARGSAPHCTRGPPTLCCTALGCTAPQDAARTALHQLPLCGVIPDHLGGVRRVVLCCAAPCTLRRSGLHHTAVLQPCSITVDSEAQPSVAGRRVPYSPGQRRRGQDTV